MRHHQAIRRTLVLVFTLAVAAAAAFGEDDVPVWQQAQRMYETAMSAYQRRQYDQAKPLFQKFVRDHGTHEEVPDAYILLAHCCSATKDQDGWDDAMDAVIRRFPGTRAWFDAYRAKLTRLVNAKQYDEFVKLLDELVRKAGGQPPVDYPGHPVYEIQWFGVRRQIQRIPNHLREVLWLDNVYIDPGWEQIILTAADTPDLAKKILQVIGKFLTTRDAELPVNWQVLHVRLLRKSGDDAQADKTLDHYAEALTDDPRGQGLWALYGEQCLDAADANGAEMAYERLWKDYKGYSQTAVLTDRWLEYLYKKASYTRFSTFCKEYLDEYPDGYLKPRVISYWMATLRSAAVAGDAKALADLRDLLAKQWGADSVATRQYMLELYLDRKEPAKAAEIGKMYLEDSQWSAGTFNRLENYAKKYPAFAPLVAEAKKKYRIFDPNDGSEAAKVLAELKGRMKDELARHIEDAAERLFQEHRETAEAVEGLRALIGYYYKKVLPDLRDKWVDRFVQSYPRHPDTEWVLRTQIEALRAHKRYEDMGSPLDLYHERFPTAGGFDWFRYRMEAYHGARDSKGAAALQAQRAEQLHRQARAGSAWAMQELFKYDDAIRGENASVESWAKFWLGYADVHKGTRLEAFCLHEAIGAYTTDAVARANQGWAPDGEKAIEVAKRLAACDCKGDPEIMWNIWLADVNVMLRYDHAAEAIDALKKRLEAAGKVRDLTARLDLGGLASAVEREPDVARSVIAALDTCEKHTFTIRDQRGLQSARASAYYWGKAYPQAVREYLELTKHLPWGMCAYGAYRGAINAAGKINVNQAKGIVDRCINDIRDCQDVVPGLLYEIGRQLLGGRNPAFNSVMSTLRSKYPDSRARGQLEAELARMQKKG